MSKAEYQHLKDARRRMGKLRHGGRSQRYVADWLAGLPAMLVAVTMAVGLFWLCCAVSGYHWE